MFEQLKQPLVVFLLALAVRGSVGYLQFDRLSADPDAYARIAETISKSGVYGLTSPDGRPVSTAYRPPLYPYLLSYLVSRGQVSRVAVAALHAGLGAITVLLAFLVCRKLIAASVANQCNAERFSLLAAGLVAIDPILVGQSTQLMTETLATSLAMAGIWWWMRCCENDFARFRGSVSSVIVLGMLLALGYLCRPTFLVWAALLGVSTLSLPLGSWKFRLGRSVLVLLPIVFALCLWTERNRRVMGHPIWATTHGGYTLLLGNNPSFYAYLRTGSLGEVWDAEPFLTAYQHRHEGDPNSKQFWTTDWSTMAADADKRQRNTGRITEYEDDRVCYHAARATIAREPGMFSWSSLVRLGRLWSPLPHQTADRSRLQVMLVGVFYGLMYTAIVIGLLRFGRAFFASPWWPVWMLAITLSVVHAIYWSNLRMRAPIMPALAVMAAVAVTPPTRKSDGSDH